LIGDAFRNRLDPLTERAYTEPFASFTAFEPGFGVSHSAAAVRPAMLCVVNSNGLHFSPHLLACFLRNV
jgi:hypothetical protein